MGNQQLYNIRMNGQAATRCYGLERTSLPFIYNLKLGFVKNFSGIYVHV
jgi:hypothetical protein